jgi:hypothetical protein
MSRAAWNVIYVDPRPASTDDVSEAAHTRVRASRGVSPRKKRTLDARIAMRASRMLTA